MPAIVDKEADETAVTGSHRRISMLSGLVWYLVLYC